MTTTPQGSETGGRSALEELRAAYHDQLTQLAAERDEARRQARRARNEAAVARADLASLTSRVQELLAAAARHLPDLPALEAPAGPPRALEAPEPEARPVAPPAAQEPKRKGGDRRPARSAKRRPVRAG
ncbi:hypothetical protein [Actinomadura litoris]|uniref:Uncharacterized protein n=1 Tax=Actinomadura litoris TaxID=2678616 RepID=A0A7K1L783_9ACTN|nr:hypothetical protein [Actinomadura litoris]MUN40035.1 hypothetical protein [Actinomadura litoris]